MVQIEKVHAEETAPLHYNKEDSLRSVIKLAYYGYRDQAGTALLRKKSGNFGVES